MKKTIALAIITVLMTGAATASVGFTQTEEFPEKFSGGETFKINTTFQNTEDRGLPVFFELIAENETGHEMEVQAFDFGIADTSVDSGGSGCLPSSFFRRNLCYFNNVTEGEYYANFQVDSSIRLPPGEYNLTLRMDSLIGMKIEKFDDKVRDKDNEAEVSNYSRFSTNDTVVWVKPENYTAFRREPILLNRKPRIGEERPVFRRERENATVVVHELNEILPEKPDGTRFIRGVQVEVLKKFAAEERNPVAFESIFFGGDKARVDAEGNVTIEFDGPEAAGLKRNTLSIYYYNNTVDEWQKVDSQRQGNSVTAEVDHFSVYALFGEPPENSGQSQGSSSDSDDEPDTGGGGIPISELNNDDEGDEINTSEDESQETESEQGSQEGSDENEGTQAEEETSQPGNQNNQGQSGPQGQQPDQGITGQFTSAASQPEAIVAGLLLILLAGIGVMQKTGRIDLRAMASNLGI